MFADAHVHMLDYFRKLSEQEKASFTIEDETAFCASSNTKNDFEEQKKLFSLYASDSSVNLFSFGIHPQHPVFDEAYFLESLLKNRQIEAIGECGFDIFNSYYKSTLEEQKKVWAFQLELADKYGLPLIIHCRKALELIFADTKRLKKLPSVIFHGWGGGLNEANAFLKKGVNAYFCIGKGLLRGEKTQKELASSFTLNRILTETDAPYMSLKDEPFSSPQDIKKVVSEIINIRGIHPSSEKEFIFCLYENFKKALT